jgi:hypothetical protein
VIVFRSEWHLACPFRGGSRQQSAEGKAMRYRRRDCHPNARSRARWGSRLLILFLVLCALGIAGAVTLRVNYLNEAHLHLEMPVTASSEDPAAADARSR